MSTTCGFEQTALEALFTEHDQSRATAATAQRSVPDGISPEGIGDLFSRAPIWVSVGRVTSQTGPHGAALVRPAILLRDAVAELGRVFFDRPEPVPIMTNWEPSITPQLLEGAARLGRRTCPLLSVFMTQDERTNDSTVSFADWKRARIVDIRSSAPWARRESMLKVPYRCAIFLGGGDAVEADANELLARQSQAPITGNKLFAVASTGGAAAVIFSRDAMAFGGGVPALHLEKPTSYTVLMKRILEITAPFP